MVVRKATRSAASGTIGCGSRAQIVARHNVTTLTSRNNSISAVAPIMNTVAPKSIGCRPRSGSSIEESSQAKKVLSKANAKTVMSRVANGRRRASRRIRIRSPASSGRAAGPASTL